MTDMGWTFWIDDNGHIRQFTVAENDLEKAKLTVQSSFPEVNFLDFQTKQRVPGELIDMLKLKPGITTEWALVNPKGEQMRIGGTGIADDRVK